MNKAEKAKILDELGGIDEADYDALVAELIREGGKQILSLEAALQRGDLDGIAKIAHAIKGAAGNLRIYRIQEIAGALESEAQGGKDRSRIASGLQGLIRELAARKAG